MARHEVKCINKTNRSSAHERISHIGGVNSDGSRWKVTSEYAITSIKSNQHSYYVRQGNHEVNVIVATRYGTDYLKTQNDGDSPDNLLSLPECP